jgi:hypothetical protein
MKIFKCLFIVFVFLAYNSFAQTWLWGEQGSASNSPVENNGWATAIDQSNNVYFGGIFQNTITFGSYTLVSGNNQSAFLVKYDINGNVLWAKQSKGTLYTECTIVSIAVDKYGYIYVTGNIYDSVNFNSFPIKGDFSVNVMLMKLDSNGNVIWTRVSKSPSGSSQTTSACVTTDHLGNVLVTGWFRDSVSFGAVTLMQPASGPHSCTDVFLTKYDSAGNVLWARNSVNHAWGGSSQGYSISVDMSDNIYLVGAFDDTIAFGSIMLFGNGCGCGYLTKYTSIGTAVWAMLAIGIRTGIGCSLYAVTTDNLNGVYVTGSSIDEMRIDSDTLINPSLSFSSTIFKFDTSGKALWKEASYVPNMYSSWYGYSISADQVGHLFLMSGSTTNGPYYLTFGIDSFYIPSNANMPSLITELDASTGKVLCGSVIVGGGRAAKVNGVVTDPTGNYIFMASWLDGLQATLGSNVVGPTNNSAEWPFIARWQPCTSQNSEGINEIKNKPEVSLYPNPSNGKFIIQSVGFNYKSLIEIYNVLGEKVYTSNVSSFYTTIDISNEANGIYLYRMIDEKGGPSSEGKFIIQK